MCHKTLYGILKIDKDASIEEIKKAYKQIALQYHPDRNSDESANKIFINATHAYDVLSNKEKKLEYDTYLGLGIGIDYGSMHNPFDDPISECEMPQGWQYDEIPGDDVDVEILITLEESASGCIKEITIQPDIVCTECDGSDPTILCNNSMHDEKKVKIHIPAGIDNDHKLRLTGMGLPGKNAAPGDLYVIVNISAHNIFTRKGKDIYLDHKVDFLVMMLGGKTMIPTLNGPAMEVEIPKGTEPGKTMMQICGSGIKDISRHMYGDMYVTLQTELPDISTARAEKLLNELMNEITK